ncbi:MAG: 3-hydroxyacyl-CoA dehydrogenase [Blastopirellula sp.]|nr:MAG: 3-hydroxyacyl-CoA dehydrogenase [Blastopirellula sp.]
MPKGKIVLVTGAGRGIGQAMAIHLAAAGAKVALSARSEAQLNETAEKITGAGGTALVIPGDLTDRAQLAATVEKVEAEWGPIEVLVNNAGVGSSSSPRPITEFDDDFWDFTFDLNVTVPYLLCKRVLPSMIEKKWGRIINISSINAKVPALHGCAYVASKHAIAGLTKAIAKEVADQGITANAICPGVTATEMNDKRIDYDIERTGMSFAEIEAQASPLGRRLTTDEMAPLAVFLASDGSAGINGQLLNVCGGTVMC